MRLVTYSCRATVLVNMFVVSGLAVIAAKETRFIGAAVFGVGGLHHQAGDPVVTQVQEIIHYARVGHTEYKKGVVHLEDVLVEETAGAHRPDVFGILAVEHGDETGDTAFHIIFEDIVGKGEPDCGLTVRG